MTNELLLVDEKDQVIGTGEKLRVHREGTLHRAFSVFMQNEDGEWLIQKRASGKYHSGGLWSNSCCSHQYKGEELSDSVRRCIEDELGIPARVQSGRFSEAGTFLYFSDLGEMKEHEIDHVLLYRSEPAEIDAIRLNPEEAESIRWMGSEDINKELEKNPESFTSWFAQAWKKIRG